MTHWSIADQVETVQVFDKQLRITGFAISKSTIARLVNIYDQEALADPLSRQKRFYVPAGTPLAILDRQYSDKGGRIWQLAATEDGLLIFIAGRNKFKDKSIASYYDSSIIKEKNVGRQTSIIAVIQTAKMVGTKQYGDVGLSQSEIYAVADPEVSDSKISIIIDRSKLGDKWVQDEVVDITTSDVEIISSDVFEAPVAWVTPFTRYDLFQEAQQIFEKTVRQGASANELSTKFSDFMESRFIENKECESEIEFGADLSGELGVDVSGMLSPVTAKLALTGKIAGTKKYNRGEDFDITRVKRLTSVYEIKTDRTRENCSSEPKSIRTTISGNNGVTGEISSGEILNAGFKSDQNGFPVYTCREEFLRLRDILSNRHGLPKSIATFVIALKGEFPSNADANKCEQLQDRAVLPVSQ